MTGEGDPVYKGEFLPRKTYQQVCLLHTGCSGATGNKLDKLQPEDKILVRLSMMVNKYVNMLLWIYQKTSMVL